MGFPGTAPEAGASGDAVDAAGAAGARGAGRRARRAWAWACARWGRWRKAGARAPRGDRDGDGARKKTDMRGKRDILSFRFIKI